MKKLLLLCFLVPIITGIESDVRAQSRVAVSPGEDHLHGSIPNRSGETRSDTLPNSDLNKKGMIYLELDSPNPPDSLRFRFWEHLVSDRMNVNPGSSLMVAGERGNLFEGSRGMTTFYLDLSPVDTYGFFSIGSGRATLAEQWYYFPGDRIRIRVDLRSGSLLFGGPEAEFYRTQYLLDQVFREEQFNSTPLMYSIRPDQLFQDSLSRTLLEKAQTRPADIYVKIQVISTPQQAWNSFLEFTSRSFEQHPARQFLNQQSSKLTRNQIRVLEARIIGELLFKGMKKAEMAWPALEKDIEKFNYLNQWANSFHLDQLDYSHPLLAQGAYLWVLMRSRAENRSLFDFLDAFPTRIGEELLAFYLLDNFNRLGEKLPELLQKSMGYVESLWIKERFEELLQARQGTFQAIGLLAENGEPFDISSLKGKTLLIHFWISGCKFCLHDHETVMKELIEHYADNPDIQILTINGDAGSNTWKESLRRGGYTSEKALNLWAEMGTGILKTYQIFSYPQKMIVGPDSKVHMQTINRMETEELTRILDGLSNTIKP